MNVASAFDRFAGRCMAGAFWFSPILKIGPIPHPGTPWINRPVSSQGIARPRLSASGQDVAHVARIPAATARCRHATVVERAGDLLQRGRSCLLSCFMIGSTVRAASALPASPPLPRMASRFGLPSFTPRALAAASAALVRCEISVRSCSAKAVAGRTAAGISVRVRHVLKEGSISAPPDRRAPLSEDRLSLREAARRMIGS
jgi:hypothetical protein